MLFRSMPKKVKEMPVAPQNTSGVKKMPMPGKEKKIKLKESINENELIYQQLEDLQDELMYETDPERKKEIEAKIEALESYDSLESRFARSISEIAREYEHMEEIDIPGYFDVYEDGDDFYAGPTEALKLFQVLPNEFVVTNNMDDVDE